LCGIHVISRILKRKASKNVSVVLATPTKKLSYSFLQ